ncbi:NUDIX hydrolase isoform 2 [Galdieria sulphuraria]|uniref:NUDIX hydrolase isoform 2 n=1 Tax=Galdieria sulphuraria TaxID=130081 RepID=M2Y7G8_GALSU|nr:NUDIX hydrolase isoform 2 [Galdieria sulphuraria]EME31774.1 NUDIX hydrolase isoform 2 [Galdieria sulphuraria]|eukprot:XP_005708294.1 NUDIX hydrolase isoform 2 [Galdieria sulphuraria]
MFIVFLRNILIPRYPLCGCFRTRRLCTANTASFIVTALTRKSSSKIDSTSFGYCILLELLRMLLILLNSEKESTRTEINRIDQAEKQSPMVGVAVALFRVPPVSTNRHSEWEILLVERGQEPGKGMWSFPGGKLEFGETLSEAFLREVKEETGLKPTIGPIFGVFDSFFSNREGKLEYHFVIIDAIGFVPSDAKPVPADDVHDARWFKVDRALKLENCTNGLTQAIERAVSLLERGQVQIPTFAP